MRAAVVIPALNEAATIKEIVEALRPFAMPIVVDDGSTDDTGSRATEAGAVVVRHEQRQGYDQALRSGLEQALREQVDVIVTMDADGQHTPAFVQQLVSPIESGAASIVIGRRDQPARVSERIFNAYTRRRFGVDDILCGMKAYRADVVQRLGTRRLEGTIGTGLALAALRAGEPHAVVSVPIEPRAGDGRFGQGLRPNLRILAALFRALVADRR